MGRPRRHHLKSLSAKDGVADVTLQCGACGKEFRKSLPGRSLNGGLVVCPHCRAVGLLRTGVVIGGPPDEKKPAEEKKEEEAPT